jgi:hypothetical protein
MQWEPALSEAKSFLWARASAVLRAFQPPCAVACGSRAPTKHYDGNT